MPIPDLELAESLGQVLAPQMTGPEVQQMFAEQMNRAAWMRAQQQSIMSQVQDSPLSPIGGTLANALGGPAAIRPRRPVKRRDFKPALLVALKLAGILAYVGGVILLNWVCLRDG